MSGTIGLVGVRAGAGVAMIVAAVWLTVVLAKAGARSADAALLAGIPVVVLGGTIKQDTASRSLEPAGWTRVPAAERQPAHTPDPARPQA
jgi:hypothetical protein